jgi:hypothetical protein
VNPGVSVVLHIDTSLYNRSPLTLWAVHLLFFLLGQKAPITVAIDFIGRPGSILRI